jgi:uncharacterized protein YkwD
MKRLSQYWKQILAVCIMAVSAIFLVVSFSNDKPIEVQKPRQTQVQDKKPEPKPKPVPSADGILVLVNEERAKVGVAPLEKSEALTRSAQAKCDDMVNNDYYGHTNPVTGKHGYEFAREHLPSALRIGENVIMRIDSDKGAMNGWMQSDSHREAILAVRHSLTGIALCQDLSREPGYFVVEHFAQMQ